MQWYDTLQKAAPVVAAIIVVLGALAGLATAIGVLLSALVAMFKLPPTSALAHAANLFNAAGLDLKKAATALVELAKKFWPSSGPAVVVVIAGAAMLLWSSPARAQQLTLGPSVPLMLVRPGDVHPVSLAPGAGLSAGVDLFPSTVFGANVHLLSVGGDTFGSVQAATQLAGAGSISLHVTLAETLTLLAGLDLYRSDSTGLFAGSFTSRNLFFGLGLDYGFIDRLFLKHQVAVVEVPAGEPKP